MEDIWDDERRKQHIHWTSLFSHLIAQWAQWLGKFVAQWAQWLGKFLIVCAICCCHWYIFPVQMLGMCLRFAFYDLFYDNVKEDLLSD